jgi:hypothetical protein
MDRRKTRPIRTIEKWRTMTDEFTRHFFRYYIAKIASQDFGSISEIALDIFVDAAIYRVTKYAREIRNLIETSGRTEPNGFDVFHVLWRYRETMKDLAGFIVDRQTPMENNVREYPISLGLKFDSPDHQDTLPFRVGRPRFDMNSEVSAPHIPRFFPSPFGERGLQRDNSLDESALPIRRETDVDRILEVMRMEMAKPPEPSRINIDCPLVESIVKSVFGQTPPEMETQL